MDKLQQHIQDIVSERDLYSNTGHHYEIGKRIFDTVISSVGLLVLTPILLAVAGAIKLDSKGPVFFIQKRVGYKGKIFNMYKFRTMDINAEDLLREIEHKNEAAGHMFKMRNDPRITRVGKVLRKTSIDELPQLVNVVKGEMSLVGPRPPLIREVEKYELWHHLRMSVRPGLTGMWQISGRNKIGFEEMVRLDLKYIKERSFRNDLKIIIRTVPVLLGDRNAF